MRVEIYHRKADRELNLMESFRTLRQIFARAVFDVVVDDVADLFHLFVYLGLLENTGISRLVPGRSPVAFMKWE